MLPYARDGPQKRYQLFAPHSLADCFRDRESGAAFRDSVVRRDSRPTAETPGVRHPGDGATHAHWP